MSSGRETWRTCFSFFPLRLCVPHMTNVDMYSRWGSIHICRLIFIGLFAKLTCNDLLSLWPKKCLMSLRGLLKDQAWWISFPKKQLAHCYQSSLVVFGHKKAFKCVSWLMQEVTPQKPAWNRYTGMPGVHGYIGSLPPPKPVDPWNCGCGNPKFNIGSPPSN